MFRVFFLNNAICHDLAFCFEHVPLLQFRVNICVFPKSAERKPANPPFVRCQGRPPRRPASRPHRLVSLSFCLSIRSLFFLVLFIKLAQIRSLQSPPLCWGQRCSRLKKGDLQIEFTLDETNRFGGVLCVVTRDEMASFRQKTVPSLNDVICNLINKPFLLKYVSEFEVGQCDPSPRKV